MIVQGRDATRSGMADRPRIAVFKDEAMLEPSWSERIAARLASLDATAVRLTEPDAVALVEPEPVDGLMWRFTHGPDSQGIAKPFLAAAEHGLGLPVWPDYPTRWHYDDKIAQAWCLRLAGAPVPDTAIFCDPKAAEAWATRARYPLVFKLRGGASSQSVTLAESPAQAVRLIQRTFARGLGGHHDLRAIARGARDPLVRRLSALPRDLARETVHRMRYGDAHVHETRAIPYWPLERTAVIFQEFLPGNEFDHRVTVIGRRAFAFRRFNRPDDFRASGSGNFDLDPAAVDLEAVRIALDVSRRLGFQSMAFDFLRGADGGFRVLEISYTFVGSAVERCPGHWDESLTWHPGSIHPADAIADDFVSAVRGAAAAR